VAGAKDHRLKPVATSDDAIGRFVAKMREHSDAAMAPIIQPLLKEMGRARNYRELKRAIVKAVAEMDLSKFVELMAQARFAANLGGQGGVLNSKSATHSRRKR
jgi:phage gp29-like protein